MIDILKEVGRGKKGARDLQYEEARYAAETILDFEAEPAQIGAFFLAERIKTESTDEILAFTEALRDRCDPFPVKNGIDCAGPYDGRKKSFLATIPAAFILSACGLPVTLHSCPSLPPKRGATPSETLEAAGISARHLPRETSIAAARESGVLFVPAERWCPPLARLRPIREQLGLRTVINTAEKLIRFSDAATIAVGVFHKSAFDKAMALLERLGAERGLVVQGVDGSEDVPIHRRSRVARFQGGHWEDRVIDPGEFGLKDEVPEEDWTDARLQAKTLHDVLEGDAPSACRNMALLNSGLRLWAAGLTSSPQEGIIRAQEALDQGLALERFRTFQKILLSHNRPIQS
ncbi:anthranilate phosphoribosyltransferase [Salinithrix halophila]|uniref:Anthranilate phosphoribosyltransferase n=1 Tax=Salinithrix halophila TaxID=1485204 RepID=A0ABV8JF58_9BACL